MNLYVIRSKASGFYYGGVIESQFRLIWSADVKKAKEWYTRQAAWSGFTEDLAKYHPLMTNPHDYYEAVPIKYSCKVSDMSDYRYRG